MASSSAHHYLILVTAGYHHLFLYLNLFFRQQPNHYTEVLQLYSSMDSTDTIVLVYSCSAVSFYDFILYMLDNILWPCPMQIWKLTEFVE